MIGGSNAGAGGGSLKNPNSRIIEAYGDTDIPKNSFVNLKNKTSEWHPTKKIKLKEPPEDAVSSKIMPFGSDMFLKAYSTREGVYYVPHNYTKFSVIKKENDSWVESDVLLNLESSDDINTQYHLCATVTSKIGEYCFAVTQESFSQNQRPYINHIKTLVCKYSPESNTIISKTLPMTHFNGREKSSYMSVSKTLLLFVGDDKSYHEGPAVYVWDFISYDNIKCIAHIESVHRYVYPGGKGATKSATLPILDNGILSYQSFIKNSSQSLFTMTTIIYNSVTDNYILKTTDTDVPAVESFPVTFLIDYLYINDGIYEGIYDIRKDQFIKLTSYKPMPKTAIILRRLNHVDDEGYDIQFLNRQTLSIKAPIIKEHMFLGGVRGTNSYHIFDGHILCALVDDETLQFVDLDDLDTQVAVSNVDKAASSFTISDISPSNKKNILTMIPKYTTNEWELTKEENK